VFCRAPVGRRGALGWSPVPEAWPLGGAVSAIVMETGGMRSWYLGIGCVYLTGRAIMLRMQEVGLSKDGTSGWADIVMIVWTHSSGGARRNSRCRSGMWLASRQMPSPSLAFARSEGLDCQEMVQVLYSKIV